jgi:CubicO group peptidase (beta-lactamase class C family)
VTEPRERPRLGGRADPAFHRVGAVFAEALAEAELGACVAVVIDGRPVVDLWGGWQDRRRSRRWARDTLVCAFSATKGVTALLALQAVAEGDLDLDAPLVERWPELDGDGREAITLRQVLSHRAGLPGFRPERRLDAEALYDRATMLAHLETEAPWWPPGEAHGYHARTFGFLVDEALRRATGESVGDRLRGRLAGDLDLDLHLGLDEAAQARCAELVPAAAGTPVPEASRPMLAAMGESGSATAAAFGNPPALRGYMNHPRFRAAELPAMNGHATARALAALYGRLAVDDGSLLAADVLAEARRVHSDGPDRVLLQDSRFGLGFMRSTPTLPAGLGPEGFGHAGAGGSLAFADPEARVGFAFLMNRMRPGAVTGNDTALALIDALRDCLA